MNDMTEKRFEEIIAAYGADPARWPDDERADAEALLASSDNARAILEDAARLDAALNEARPPHASSALMGRVLDSAKEANRPSFFGRMGGVASLLGAWPTPMRAAAGLAAVVVLVAGIALLQPDTRTGTGNGTPQVAQVDNGKQTTGNNGNGLSQSELAELDFLFFDDDLSLPAGPGMI